MRTFLAASAALILSGAGLVDVVWAQAPSPAESVEENNSKAVDYFLDQKSKFQQRRGARISARGETEVSRDVEKLLRALDIKKPKPFDTANQTQIDSLQNSLIMDATQLLVLVDMKPGRIKQLQSAGSDPLISAISLVRGTATLRDQAILADYTVLAKISAVKFESLGDGFGSTVTFDVVKSYVGPPAIKRLQVRQMSGKSDDGSQALYSGDMLPGDEQTYLISLSHGAYEEGVIATNKQPELNTNGRAKYLAQLGTRYMLDGQNLIPIHGTTGATDLTSADKELAGVSKSKN